MRSPPDSTTLRRMQSPLSYRHRLITEDDLVFIRALIAGHPESSRWALSKKLCEAWNWVQANGVWAPAPTCMNFAGFKMLTGTGAGDLDAGCGCG